MCILHKTYQYRLHLTRGQAHLLGQQLEECRWVYNQTLATRKQVYEDTGTSLSLCDTINLLPDWKAERKTLKLVHSQVLQHVQLRVDLAFKAFFRRVKAKDAAAGFPRFKGFGRYDSLTYPQYGNGARLDGERVIIYLVQSGRSWNECRIRRPTRYEPTLWQVFVHGPEVAWHSCAYVSCMWAID